MAHEQPLSARALAALLALAGCVERLDREERVAGTVVRDCVLPGEPRSAPLSLEFVEARTSVWIWPSADNAFALVTDAETACATGVSVAVDDDGDATPLVGLTPAERAANASRGDGRRLVIEPVGGFVHEGVGFLYYEHALIGPGFFDRERLGAGVCRCPSPGAPCERASEDPLWGPTEPTPGETGFVGADGRALLLRRMHAAAFDDFATFARVAPEDAADPSAYEYQGLLDWTPDASAAIRSFDAPGRVTLRREPWIGRPIVTSADVWSSTMALRVFEEGEEPDVGPPVTLVQAVPPHDWFIGGGSEHAALGSEDGRDLVVSYSTDPTGQNAELHLVTVRLAGRGP
jgi:hypothetical protein